MTEHSEPDHRNELFAVQFAIQNVTNIIAAVLGGGRGDVRSPAGWASTRTGPGTYRIILVIMGVLMVAALADRGAAHRRPPEPGRRAAAAGGWASRRPSRRSAAFAAPGWASRSATGRGSRGW